MAKLLFINKKNIVIYDLSIGQSIQINNYILKKSTQNNGLTRCDWLHHSRDVHRKKKKKKYNERYRKKKTFSTLSHL